MAGVHHTTLPLMHGGGQNLSYGTASATASTGFPAGTTFVRLVSTTDVYIEIGSATTASAGTAAYLAAFTAEYFPAAPDIQVSARAAATNGTLNIKPCSG